jgi:hypothetical protein
MHCCFYSLEDQKKDDLIEVLISIYLQCFGYVINKRVDDEDDVQQVDSVDNQSIHNFRL